MSSWKRKPESSVAFSVSVTPKRAKVPEEEVVAVLAPFNPFPKVEFESVKINKSESRQITIVNPTKNEISIKLTKLPEASQGFEFSFTECEIPNESETKLFITWTPLEYGSGRHNVKIMNKKSKKTVSELILLTSTEEPPRRCLRSRIENSKLKSTRAVSQKTVIHKTKITSEVKENKENILTTTRLQKIPESKKTSSLSQSKTNTTFSKESSLVTSSSKSSFTSLSVYASETTTSARRTTYEVLKPVECVKSTKRSMNKRVSTVQEIEREKLSFETIASPGCLNESLEKAASNLIEVDGSEIDVKMNLPSNRTFLLDVDVNSTPFRRETFEVFTPSASLNKQTSTEGTSQTTANTLCKLSFGSVHSEQLEDSLEVEKKPNFLDNLDTFDFDKVSLSPQNNDNLTQSIHFTKSLGLPSVHVTDEHSNFDEVKVLSSPKVSCIKTEILSDTIEKTECINIKSESVDPNEFVVNITFEKDNESNFNVLSDVKYPDSLNSNSSKDHVQILCDNIDTIEFSPSNSRRSSEIGSFTVKHEIENPTHPFTVVKNAAPPKKSEEVNPNIFYIPVSPIRPERFSSSLNDAKSTSTSAVKSPNMCFQFKDSGILDGSFKHSSMIDGQSIVSVQSFSIPSVSVPGMVNKGNSSEIRNMLGQTTSELINAVDFNEKKDLTNTTFSTQSKTESAKGNDSMKERTVNITPKSNVCNREQNLKSEDATQKSLPEHNKQANFDVFNWDISPPKKQKQECKSVKSETCPMPRMKSTLLKNTPRSTPLSHPTQRSTSSIKSGESSSGEIFAVPALVMKRCASNSKSCLTSPSKMRKLTPEVKVKRLALNPSSLRKTILSTPGNLKVNSEAVRSTRSTIKKRQSIKVTDWMMPPVGRKLKLSRTSSQSGDSEVDSPDTLKHLATPSPLLAATSLNPFTEGGLYFSPEWLEEQKEDLLNWADRLLQPPSELQLHRDQQGTLFRLNALRNNAFFIFTAPETATVLSKVKVAVDRGIIAIRKDKELHADLGLQAQVMDLLMCYNPLWLRLCLEAMYQCSIHLRCHADEAGLKRFIRDKLLSDDFIKSTNCHPTIPHVYLPQFEEKMKKFTLYKFLVVVYLLDLVKCKKLMIHDPCLFKKDAKIKNSKDILVEFNKEFISGAGDINKKLRSKGYEVIHSQTYLDEYDFTVKSVGDLRDGVRLTKMAELITENHSLLSKLRVPAISSLQKKHNAEIALSALKSAGREIPKDIVPKDISDGHKEKTFSLLWHLRGMIQKRAVNIIIVKWRETRPMRQERRKFLNMKNAAIKIQKWFRRQKQRKDSQEISLKAKEVRESFLKMKAASIAIQKWYRNHLNAKAQRNTFLKMRSATLCIQKRFKATLSMKRDKDHYQKIKSSVICIQRRYRATVVMRRERQQYLKIKSSVLCIQKTYRKRLLVRREHEHYLKVKSAVLCIQRKYKATILMRKERESYLRMKSSVMCIQKRFRAWTLMKRERENFIRMKKAAEFIQRLFRITSLMRKEKENYKRTKSLVIFIQRKYRALRQMKKEHAHYLKTKSVIVYIQRKYKSKLLMRKERANYLKMKSSVQLIQNKFRARVLMRNDRENYLKTKKAALFIQRRYRALNLMKKDKAHYQNVKSSIVYIQRKLRATLLMRKERREYEKKISSIITLQRRLRAKLLMKKKRKDFVKKRSAALFIQRKFREKLRLRKEVNDALLMKAILFVQRRYKAKLAMRRQMETYLKIKSATVVIQRRYRTIQLMKKERQSYLNMKVSSINIQRRFKAKMLMKKEREHFLKAKTAITRIQRRYRAVVLMKQEREKYLDMKSAILCIQRKFRAMLLMKQDRKHYHKIRSSVIFIQRKFKATLAMRKEQENYLKMKSAAISIQRMLVAKKLMRKERKTYLKIKSSVICIQRRYRAMTSMKKERQQYLTIKSAITNIQRRYRATNLMKQERQSYLKIKSSVLFIQRSYRARVLMKQERQHYFNMKHSIICMQKRFRSTLAMRKERENYLKIKSAIICIQRRYRALKLMRNEREAYQSILSSITCIQRQYRAMIMMKICRKRFLAIKSSVLCIQKRYRATALMMQERQNYLKIKCSVLCIQRRYRATNLMKQERQNYLKIKSSVLCIQRRYRATNLMKQERQNYLNIKSSVLSIQRRYRAINLMKLDRQNYLKIKSSVLCIQRRYRAVALMKQERQNYLKIQSSVLSIQRRYRATNLMKLERQNYLKIKSAVLCIQRRYRALTLMRIEREQYLKIKASVILIQRKYRAMVFMKQNRQNYLMKKSSIIYIQQKFRAMLLMKQERQRFITTKSSVICVQRQFRALLSMKRKREEYIKVKSAVVCIQRKYRAILLMRKERHNYLETKSAIVHIQRWYRSMLVMKKERMYYQKMISAATIIQRRYRDKLKSRYVQEQLKNQALQAAAAEARLALEKAAVKIQAMWRGKQVRHKIVVPKPQKKSEEDKTLVQQALNKRGQHLLVKIKDKNFNRGTVAQMLNILSNLDTLTVYSRSQCEYFANAQVVKTLYWIIGESNRAHGVYRCVERCLLVLCNLHRCPSTAEILWQDTLECNGFDQLSDLILKNRMDKFNTIFCKSLTLLWLWAQQPNKAQVIKESRVHETLKFVAKDKSKLLAGNTMKNVKTAASKQLPSLKPNWGGYFVHLRAFEEKIFAFDSVSKLLNIN